MKPQRLSSEVEIIIYHSHLDVRLAQGSSASPFKLLREPQGSHLSFIMYIPK